MHLILGLAVHDQRQGKAETVWLLKFELYLIRWPGRTSQLLNFKNCLIFVTIFSKCLKFEKEMAWLIHQFLWRSKEIDDFIHNLTYPLNILLKGRFKLSWKRVDIFLQALLEKFKTCIFFSLMNYSVLCSLLASLNEWLLFYNYLVLLVILFGFGPNNTLRLSFSPVKKKTKSGRKLTSGQ